MGSRGRHEIPWGWSYRQLSADVGAGYQNQVLCKGSKHSSKQIPWHFGDCLNTTSHWRPPLFLFRSVFSCCMAYNVHSEWRSPLLPTESFRRPAVLWSTSPRCLSLLSLFLLLQGGTDTGLVWSLWVVPSLWDRETVLPKCWNKLSVSSAEVLEKQSGVDIVAPEIFNRMNLGQQLCWREVSRHWCRKHRVFFWGHGKVYGGNRIVDHT